MKKEMILELIEMAISGRGKACSVEKGRYIVIGNRGNIVVGELTVAGEVGTLKNAAVIRRWGTTQGLGQLAISGATESTVTDYCGEFEFHMQTICGMIKVESDFGKRK